MCYYIIVESIPLALDKIGDNMNDEELIKKYKIKLNKYKRRLKMIKYRLEVIKYLYNDDKNLVDFIDFRLEVYDDKY